MRFLSNLFGGASNGMSPAHRLGFGGKPLTKSGLIYCGALANNLGDFGGARCGWTGVGNGCHSAYELSNKTLKR